MGASEEHRKVDEATTSGKRVEATNDSSRLTRINPPEKPDQFTLNPLNSLGLNSSDRGDLMILSERTLEFVRRLPALPATIKEELSPAVWAGNLTDSLNTEVRLVRVSAGNASAASQTLQAAIVLTELGALPQLQGMLPNVLGVTAVEQELHLVVDAISEPRSFGIEITSFWKDLSTNYPALADRFKAAFAPSVIRRMEEGNTVDVEHVGFDELCVSATGQLLFNFDFERTEHFVRHLREGAIFRLEGLAEDSFILSREKNAAALTPWYVVREANDMERLSCYRDENRSHPDITQDGRSFIQYGERGLAQPHAVLSESLIPTISTVEEALLLAARRYNQERGKSFEPGSQSIGYELGLTLCVLEDEEGDCIVAFCGTPGEETSVDNVGQAVLSIGMAYPSHKVILVDGLHTHELYDYHMHTGLHSVDTRSVAWQLLADPNGHLSVNENHGERPAGSCWQVEAMAACGSIVFFVGPSHRDEPAIGFRKLDSGAQPRVGVETTAVLLNGDKFTAEVSKEEKGDIREALLLLQKLKGNPVFAQQVAANLLKTVCTSQSQVQEFRP